MNASDEELASGYVLDQLAPHERADFEARLLREPELVALVREFESGLEHGVRSLPPREPRAELLARLEARIDREEGQRRREERHRAAPGFTLKWVAGWGLAAVIALSLSILAIQSLRRPAIPPLVIVELDANRASFAELPARGQAADPDGRFIQLASLAQDLWDQPARRPAPANTRPDASRGYALFDPTSQQGFIAIEKLPALDPTQRYHLWVADALTGRVRDAGVLPLAGSSRGLYSFALAPAHATKTDGLRLFVTVEDATAGQANLPRGAVVLGDRAL
jgi:hypothetical protein